MNTVLAYLESLPPSAWMRSGVWTFPIVNTLHLFGIAFLFGGIANLDLRLLGLARTLPAAELARLVLPTAITGFALAVTTGALMFAANAREYAANPYLPWKLGFVALAGLNIGVLHASAAWRTRDSWGGRIPRLARIAAVASLTFWAGTITCGRLMACF